MPLRSATLQTSRASTVKICVDSCMAAELSGRAYYVGKEQGIFFHSLSGLILKLDALFDTIRFPQAHFKHGSFFEGRAIKRKRFQKERHMDNTGMDLTSASEGERATFVVEVLFRRNATWQGRVEWIDKKQSKNFRSALELMKLMGEALEQEYGSDEEYTGWEKP